ncbi:hypothetical protein MKX01_021033 [Papaver californicum]|nr:hypothetical protein MKX01_021033 [Papaver californicum]
MIRMLDLVLKLFPEDSKEPQTARILLYKIFNDQTDQGMTQFLINLIRNFNTRKQPKRLLKNLGEEKKKKLQTDKKAVVDDSGDVRVNEEGDVGLSTGSVDSDGLLEDCLANPSSDGEEESTLIPDMFVGHEGHLLDTGNIVEDSTSKENIHLGPEPDDLECEMGESSEDNPVAATDEIDFSVSTLVSMLQNNSVIQNLCWLLKFYKSNSTGTNHYIIRLLRRIYEDLELSPMLYQLSFLTTFYNILAEQKSSPQKEYINIVSFLTDLIRKMLRKMKSQPLLFVEVLWKTRKECQYMSSEILLNELGNLRKESRKWGTVSSGNEGEFGSSLGQDGMRRRSIADTLGDDEFDVVVPQEGSHRMNKSDDQSKSNTSRSDSDIEGMEQPNFSDTQDEGHSFKHKSLRVPKRRRKLIFDSDLETNIKSLYEKYREDRHCARLIVKSLDPDGNVSPVQVSNKLKHHSRKSVRAFSHEQEKMLKDLYEQYTNDKKCSHMIATTLDTNNTFSAAQVPRKLKQLGLIKKRPVESKKLLRDEADNDNLTIDELEEESEEEMLLALKRSRKIEMTASEDDGDDQVLCSIFHARRISSKAHDEKRTISLIDDTINEDHGDNIEREQNHNMSSLLHKDVKKGFAAIDVDKNTDQARSPTGDDLLNNVDHTDSDDDVGPVVSKSIVKRRKMVIDNDDE